MKVFSLGFSQDLDEHVFEQLSDACILIYPTRIAADIARRRYEARWNLERLSFISMEDFKRSLILLEKPMPEDDKRLLCLHQVLSQEDREHFHLYEYQDLVLWGTEFFQFCEELFEANIPLSDILSWQEHPRLGLRIWQEKNLERIYAILLRYQEALSQRGFMDRIFHGGAAEAQITFTAQRIIVVNQYYYSQLERELLLKCEMAGNELILFYHGTEAADDGWTPRPLQLSEAWASLAEAPQIQIFECENKRQAALAFLAMETGESPVGIIDSHFWQEDYSAWFAPQHLRTPLAMPITESAWYRMARILLETLKEMANSAGYIPIRLILKYINTYQVSSAFCPAWQPKDHLAFRTELLALFKDENLYLDPDIKQQIRDPNNHVYQFITAFQKLICQIKGIQNSRDLEALLAGELAPQRFAMPIELSHTDLCARLWEALANFRAIEELGFVKSWQELFAEPAVELFELWLDYIKSLRLKREAVQNNLAAWEMSNLLDARNRSFETLAVFNLVEGVLPAAPNAIWLLNEHQRKVLGLKYYDQIREWERYYFFRLLFLARHAKLFTYIDKDKAIDHSSFIGEILALFEDQGFEIQILKVDEKSLFTAWQAQQDHDNIALDIGDYNQKSQEDFFCLPRISGDFGSNQELAFGSYDLRLFTGNLFAWYIDRYKRIGKQNLPRRELISPTLFGNLMHSYFAKVLGSGSSYHPDASSLKTLFSDTAALTQTLKDLIYHADFKYKIPKNYNADYLEAIISERLAESLQEFYYRFLCENYAHTSFTMIPEDTEQGGRGNRRAKLCSYQHQNTDYSIMLKGRADLLIESEALYYIVDFKTGAANSEQLIFYEWLYYLLEDPKKEEYLRSCFWRILDMSTDANARSDARKRERYYENIISALDELFATGYTMGTKSEFKRILSDISRSDLYIEGSKNASVQ